MRSVRWAILATGLLFSGGFADCGEAGWIVPAVGIASIVLFSLDALNTPST